jgi:hypothetical protein
MELQKLNKASLEDILCDLMNDLEKVNKPLLEKYENVVDEKLYHIDETEAQHIVKNMKPYGEVYSLADIKDIITRAQISEDHIIKYYLCMNMFYNDYKTYPESRRLDIKDFCFEMSKLFINDVDAPKYKVENYFKTFEETL